MQYSLFLDSACYRSLACYLAAIDYKFPVNVDIGPGLNLENNSALDAFKVNGKKLGIQYIDVKPLLIINTGTDLIKVNGIRSILLYIYSHNKNNTNFYDLYHYFDIFEDLEKLLNSVNKTQIDIAFKELDKHFTNNNYLLDKITPADIYLYSMLSAFEVIPWNNLLKFHSSLERFAAHSNKFKLSKCFNYHSNKRIAGKNNVYVATAIAYTNGPPHIGHVYENILSDVISRYHAIAGDSVTFSVGTDEHGQKIANTALKHNVPTLEFCNGFYNKFVSCYEKVHINHTAFVRTTSDKHKKTCQFYWNKIMEKGDIYLGVYKGWYNEREETFVSPNEAKTNDYKDPQTGVPYKIMEEESYFFRMSKYQKPLLEYIHANPDFITPEARRNDILNRLSIPLEDLSISRSTFSWGIKVPGSDTHIMYVWMDALMNYITAVSDDKFNINEFWPPKAIVIGKDILWFHSVIFSTLLMSIGLPLPKSYVVHGFIHATDNRKMSKSFDNVVDPMELLEKFPADTLRYYFVKSTSLGLDIRFGVDMLADAHNNELSDCIGNLVHRVTGLCAKYCDSKVPEVSTQVAVQRPFDPIKVINEFQGFFSRYDLYNAVNYAVEIWRETNKYLTNQSPWALSDKSKQNEVIRVLLESIYFLSHLIYPVTPYSSGKIFNKLNTPRRDLPDLSFWFDNLEPNTNIEIGEILFTKVVNQ